MRPRIIRMEPYAAADANAISLSQTPAAGGLSQDLTITGVLASGGVATLDEPRQVVITPAADDSGRFFYVRGTGAKGNLMEEAVAGGNATATSTVQAFNTVTRVSVDGDTAGAVQVGTGDIVSSNWMPLDYLALPFAVALSLQVSLATTPDFTVELTLTNLLRRRGSGANKVVIREGVLGEFDLIFPPHVVNNHDTLISQTANATGNIAFPVRAVRLKSNQVFTVDTVSLQVIQASGRR